MAASVAEQKRATTRGVLPRFVPGSDEIGEYDDYRSRTGAGVRPACGGEEQVRGRARV
jgi:hypothetical protein